MTVFIGTHGVDIVIESDKACVTEATCHQPDRYVVAAEFGERVSLVSRQVDAKAKLAVVVSTP